MKKIRVVKENKLVEEAVLEQVVCNRCGKETNFSLNDDPFEKNRKKEETQSFDISFGYGSQYGGENWSFDLCEECLFTFVNTFKTLPQGFGKEYADYEFPRIPFEELEEPVLKEKPEEE